MNDEKIGPNLGGPCRIEASSSCGDLDHHRCRRYPSTPAPRPHVCHAHPHVHRITITPDKHDYRALVRGAVHRKRVVRWSCAWRGRCGESLFFSTHPKDFLLRIWDAGDPTTYDIVLHPRRLRLHPHSSAFVVTGDHDIYHSRHLRSTQRSGRAPRPSARRATYPMHARDGWTTGTPHRVFGIVRWGWVGLDSVVLVEALARMLGKLESCARVGGEGMRGRGRTIVVSRARNAGSAL
ncbi:hypothetical protein C8R45DRAFT_1043837 [Mycena sanguinolenta]|nr:hypothetical protein C8R45DRAFT_1043837 [Mycena sanguinolenta]